MPVEPLLLAEHYRKHARTIPHKIALIDEGGTLTYGELGQAIEAHAAALIEAGVKKGDRVATAMESSIAHLVAIMGAMAAGAVPCVLNTRLTEAEFGRFLAPIDPVLIVADQENAGAVAALKYPRVVMERATAKGGMAERMAPLWATPRPLPQVSESDYAIIIPTGGTTGTPKGAFCTHRSLWLWVSACGYNAGRISQEVEMYISPFFHVSIMAGWMSTLFAGGQVRIVRKFTVDDALDAIEAGATMFLCVPAMLLALRDHPRFATLDRSKVRAVTVGSMAAATELVAQMRKAFPNARMRHSYGATEFGPVCAILDEDFSAGRVNGVGRPLPGCTITVVDDDMRPLPLGQIGELMVSAPWRMEGYWGNPKETEATFTPMGVRLGDLGFMNEEGWVTIVGRRKEMIITGGENVFPNEVEAMLRRHPAISDICVYGVKDKQWGERVEAAVVLRPGASLTAKELADFGRAELAGYKLPKTMRILDAIPLTSNNKSDRRGLSQESEALGAKAMETAT